MPRAPSENLVSEEQRELASALGRASRIKAGENSRQRILEALYAHHGQVHKALESLPLGHGAYEKHRKNHPDWAKRVDSIKALFYTGRRPAEWDSSFKSFRQEFFGMHTYPHQERLVEALDSVKPREIVLVLMHPESGKTTTVEDWICLKIGKNPNLRIAYLSEATGLARKVVGRLKMRMTDPRFLDYQLRFGPFYAEGQERGGKPWTADYITVCRADHDERDFTLEARAVTSAAQGSRIDILIGDDVQSRRTLSQTESTFAFLRQTYMTRGRNMSMVFLGNRLASYDIYDRMIESGIVDRLIEIPATGHEDRPMVPEYWVDDPTSFPDMDAIEVEARRALTKIRAQVGEDVWWSSYQQRPTANALASFTEDTLNAAKDYTRIIPANKPAGALVYLSLDPALGGMNALIAAQLEADRLILLDCQTDTDFAESEQILNGIRTFAARYRPARVIIEQNAFQKGLANDLRLQRMGVELGFRVHSHLTGREKQDPILGVAAMAGSFHSGQIRIPWGDDQTRAHFAPLIAQLTAWRPNVPTRLLQQDTVMALWFAWKQWQAWTESLKRSAPIQPLWRPAWMKTG